MDSSIYIYMYMYMYMYVHVQEFAESLQHSGLTSFLIWKAVHTMYCIAILHIRNVLRSTLCCKDSAILCTLALSPWLSSPRFQCPLGRFSCVHHAKARWSSLGMGLHVNVHVRLAR